MARVERVVTKSRNEIFNYFVREGAHIDIDASLRNPHKFYINGDKNSGKSLIWDAVKAGVFAGDGDLVKGRSWVKPRLVLGGYRVYETWEGQSASGQKPIRIFFCNLAALKRFGKMPAFADKLEVDGVSLESLVRDGDDGALLNHLGNIILLQNARPARDGDRINLKFNLAGQMLKPNIWARSFSVRRSSIEL